MRIWSVFVIVVTIFVENCEAASKTRKQSERPTLIASDSQILPILIDDKQSITNPPTEKDLKLSKLTKAIGDDFEPHWMSINEPRNKNMGIIDEIDNDLIDEFRNLSMKYRDDNGNRVRISADTEAVFEKWLTQRSNCPIEYKWIDLGQLFWPRWVKRGECVQKKCSWPSGMQCRSTEMLTIQPLRWHCIRKGRDGRRREKRGTKYRCKWIRVPFPITSKCSCQCKKI
ncbi:noggin-2-like [Antedon mediterranea]|uniref:noggin-2-like n=1 Tax=Antedon mediterranea TaxID=105859 RepID=UPI003AF690BD